MGSGPWPNLIPSLLKELLASPVLIAVITWLDHCVVLLEKRYGGVMLTIHRGGTAAQ